MEDTKLSQEFSRQPGLGVTTLSDLKRDLYFSYGNLGHSFLFL